MAILPLKEILKKEQTNQIIFYKLIKILYL